MKDNINEDLKAYTKSDLKLEIINELKLEIRKEIKKERTTEIGGGAINNIKTSYKEIKSTRTCCYCKIETNKDRFYISGG